LLVWPSGEAGISSFNAEQIHRMEASARHLAFHGTVVLLIGLLCGGPYARAINNNAPPHTVHSWRVAHASLPIGAVLMFSIAAVLSSFVVAAQVKWVISSALVVSSYAFCFSLPLAAFVGHRGLSPHGPLAAKLVFGGNMVGAWASIVASVVLLYASFVSL
jgi:hypothetical protein